MKKLTKRQIANRYRLIEALYSGQYKQTRGRLRRTYFDEPEPISGFCCLGVMCDLHDNTKWKGENYGRYELRPPISVAKAFGLHVGDYKNDGFFLHAEDNISLPKLNDNWGGLTFAEIADCLLIDTIERS